MNRKTVGFRIPIKRDMLDDDAAIAEIVTRLLYGARLELDKVSEGRPCQIDEVRILFLKDHLLSIPDVRVASAEVTVEIKEEEAEAFTLSS